MKHRSSQILYEHWNEKRASRLLPERGEIDPAGIRTALGDTFILAFNPLPEHPFRLAGTRVCALFGRELKGTAFTSLWRGAHALRISQIVGATFDDAVGVVAGVSAVTSSGDPVDLELLLLPLRHCGQTHLRLIGSLAPLGPQPWIGGPHLTGLTLRDYRYLGHRTQIASPPLAFSTGASGAPPRIRRGFVVYDGGQN